MEIMIILHRLFDFNLITQMNRIASLFFIIFHYFVTLTNNSINIINVTHQAKQLNELLKSHRMLSYLIQILFHFVLIKNDCKLPKKNENWNSNQSIHKTQKSEILTSSKPILGCSKWSIIAQRMVASLMIRL